MSALARPDRRPDLELDDLRAQLASFERALEARRAEVTQLKADFEGFRIRYRQQVGLLHEELDELELQVAEAELGQLSQRLQENDAPSSQPSEPPPAESASRLTTDAVRKLFREVAKSIHPDLAADDSVRARRHALMVEANRAYALGDEQQLRAILRAWEKSPEAVQGVDEDAMRLRMLRRIAQIESDLADLAHETARLQSTSLWQLKTMVDGAAAQGKDLIDDMVRRLRRDILVARNRLDALTWSPSA